MRTTTHFRSLRLALAAAAASASLTGCGMFGSSWDVRMEVQGTGAATIAPRYAGDGDSLTGKPNLEQLPWSTSANVGFGWNRLDVTGAAPGTTCKITADGKTIQEKPVDAQGNATCEANLQDD